MFAQKWLYRAGLFTLALSLAAPADAQGGKGGYAKITPLAGTKEISVTNDGTKYFVVNKPISVSFKVQGAPGKRRKKTRWTATVGKWESFVIKPDKFEYSLSLTDVYDRNKLSNKCEQLLTLAAAQQGKAKETLRNNGWKDWFTYKLQYETIMWVENPFTLRKGLLTRQDNDSQDIVVRCLGHKRTSEPRPNKKADKKKSKKTSQKTEQTVSLKGKKLLQNDKPSPARMAPARETRDRPVETVTFNNLQQDSGETSPARETDAPETQAIGSTVTMAPRSDLYPETGGIDGDDGKSFALLIGNAGTAPAAATQVRVFVKINNQPTVSGDYPIPALAAGEFHELKVPSLIPLDWIETAYARIDEPSVVAELDETNNAYGLYKDRKASTVADTGERAPYYKIKMEKTHTYTRPEGIRLTADGGRRATAHRRWEPLRIAGAKKD